jgi:chromosomal replication initiation ATPase DnaA
MTTMRHKMGQIPLDLTPKPDFTFDSFIEAPSNAGAFNVVRAWPAWPAPAMMLLGPEGTGKTHLGEAWLAVSHGVFLDDAHTRTEDDLFGLINRALRGEIPGLLLASRVPPNDWGVTLPDLTSRLGAMPVMQLHEPDDDSLHPITRALFEQQGRVVGRDVVDYLLKYTDRSVPALRATIRIIDAAASSAKVDVTKLFAAKVLRDNLDLFDDE